MNASQTSENTQQQVKLPQELIKYRFYWSPEMLKIFGYLEFAYKQMVKYGIPNIGIRDAVIKEHMALIKCPANQFGHIENELFTRFGAPKLRSESDINKDMDADGVHQA